MLYAANDYLLTRKTGWPYQLVCRWTREFCQTESCFWPNWTSCRRMTSFVINNFLLSSAEVTHSIFDLLIWSPSSDKWYTPWILHIALVLKELCWLPIRSIWCKCVEGLAPSYLRDRLAERYFVHDRNVTNKNSLNIPAYRSAWGQRTSSYRAITFWNSTARASW